MSAKNSFSYKPIFTKNVCVGGSEVVRWEISEDEKDDLISRLAAKKELVAMMLEYIRLYRQETPCLSESDEIALRQKIFPYFDDVMCTRKLMMFSPEIAEEMFQRLETGVLKVDLS